MGLRSLQPGLAPDEVERLRWDTFGHRRTHSLHSCEDLAAFTRDRGFVLQRPEPGLHYPSVLEATVGRPLFDQAWDERSLQARAWARDCVAQGHVVAMALLARRETLVAPDYVRDFFLLSELQGDEEDFRRRREQGKLGQDASALCEAVQRHGRAVSRTELAKQLSMQGVLGARRLGKAFQEGLQQLLLVIVDWKPAADGTLDMEPVVDLLPRACGGLLHREVAVSPAARSEARQRILGRYLRNVLVEGCHEMAQVLGWTEADTREALQALEKRKEVLEHPSSRHNRWFYQAAATDLLG